MEPAEPLVAEPVRSTKDPVLPEVDVPVLIVMDPLTPSDPLLELLSENAPLVAVEPNPVLRDTDPPVTSVLRPADTTIRPPAPISPFPMRTLRLPAAP